MTPGRWPAGGGEMARLVREHDWASTPLGPIEGWPQGLKTAVDVVLAMPGPATILWGPEHVQLYNDAYIAVARDRHPALLGLPAAEGWPDAYEGTIAPLLDGVRLGRSTELSDYPVALRGPDGRSEERVFDTAFSPVRDESGGVAGALQTLAEVTGRKRAEAALRESEERRAFLLGLSDALRPLADPEEIRLTAARVLGRHLGASRVAYAEDAGDGEHFDVTRNYVAGAAEAAGRFRYADFGADILSELEAGRTRVQPDIGADRRLGDAEKEALAAVGVGASLNVPLVKAGRLVAFLGVNYPAAHDFRPAEIALVGEVAERTWAAVERARAEAALRESEEKFRSLFETMGQGYNEAEVVRDDTGRAIDYRFNFLNPAFERLTGIPVADAVGRTAREIVPGLEDHWIELVDRVVRSGEPEHVEQELAPLGRWYEVHVYPAGGDRFIGIYEDITERKRREADRELLVDISEDLGRLSDEEEILRNVGAKLAAHLELACFHYVDVDEERAEVTVRHFWHALDVPHILGTYPIDGFLPPRGLARMRAGETSVSNDVQNDLPGDTDATAALKAGAAAQKIGAYVAVPYSQDGRWKAYFAAADSRPRRWTDLEIELVQEVSGRLLPRIERVRAEAALRESEERQAFLLKLSDALRPIANPVAVQETASRMTAEHLDIGRVTYCEVRHEPDAVVFVERDWPRRGMPSIAAGRYRMDDFGTFLAQELAADRPAVVADAAADPRLSPADRENWGAYEIRASCALPVVKEGRFVACLVAQDNRRRDWTDPEIALLREVSERVWATVDRARAEEALRASEERYRTLFETMDEGFVVGELTRDDSGKPIDFRYLELNPAVERLVGWRAKETVGRLMSEMIPAAETALWVNDFAAIVASGTSSQFEHFHESLGQWYRANATPVGADRIALVYQNVTAQKRADHALRESEERQAFLLRLSDRLRTEVDARAIAAASLGLLADHLRLDRAYVAQVDKDRDLAEIGPEHRRPDLAPVEGVLTLSDFPEAFARVEAATLVLADTAADPTLSDPDRRGFAGLRMGALIVASARRGTRNPIWALLVATEEPRRWTAAEVALVEEAAERTWAAIERARAEAALRESEEKYRTLVENVGDHAVFMLDPGGFVTEWTDSAERVKGYSTEEVIGRHVSVFYAPEAIEAGDPEGELREAAREGRAEREQWRVKKGGERIFVEEIATAVRDEAGELVGFTKISRDLTERRRAEEALRVSEERLRLAADAAGLGGWQYVPETGELAGDDAFVELHGATPGARLGFEGHMEAIHPDDRERVRRRVSEAVEGREGYESEYRVRLPDGSVRWLLSRGRFVGSDGSPERLVGVTLDVTGRRELEKERERAGARELTAHAEAAERERTSRELHDRVAHHMGVAHQSLELHAALKEAAPDRAEEKLVLARETTRLALDQTRALSAELKRLQEEELEDGLGAALRALPATMSDGVEVSVRASGDESAVPEPVALQVYLAMREAVRNAVRHSGGSRVGVELDISDGEVVGSVEDDGRGFDPEAVGNATPSWGVGLRSMGERAEMLGGSTRVESAPGAGTRVEVRVPLDGRRP